MESKRIACGRIGNNHHMGDDIHLHCCLFEAFQPVEILFFRFVMGYLALWLVCPRRLTGVGRR